MSKLEETIHKLTSKYGHLVLLSIYGGSGVAVFVKELVADAYDVTVLCVVCECVLGKFSPSLDLPMEQLLLEAEASGTLTKARIESHTCAELN